MVKYLSLDEAVDRLIDEMPEGAPFRDGTVFVRGDFFELIVDPTHPLNGQVFRVVRTDRNDAGEATVSFPPESPSASDRRIQANLCRLSDQKYLDSWTRRRRFALPLIVRECEDSAWKASGKKPGSAEREDIPCEHFVNTEINEYTGDLMAPPGPTSNRPESKVAIWTELRFSVPSSTNQEKAAELSELAEGAERTAATHTKVETEQQYLEHVRRTKSSRNRYPTVEEDEGWRQAKNIPRARLRELRTVHNPRKRGGAPKKLSRKT